jgi:NAD(P)-dependent dehydrogenase (short-subunit alcohol dehydrogenase family)
LYDDQIDSQPSCRLKKRAKETHNVRARHAITIGGGSGIGLAVAGHFAASGAASTIIDLDVKRVEDSTTKIRTCSGAQILGLVADIRSRVDLAAAFSRSVLQNGPIDALVVTAGVLKPALLAEMSDADYDLTFDVNTKGFWNSVNAALAHLSPEGASIVAISSASGQRPKAGNGAYAASKAALQFLVRTFALELAARKIRVNCVSPSTLDTPLTAGFAAEPAAGGYKPSAPPPIGRLCMPEDIARAVAFLCSDDASFITGTTLSVDGGLTAGIPLSH